jgi:ABC-2 type transport system ATP-binding protein
MNNLCIDVKNLNKHFGEHHVVKDFSLQVAKGEIYGFLGPNGSGKTTSIRMMCGLITRIQVKALVWAWTSLRSGKK